MQPVPNTRSSEAQPSQGATPDIVETRLWIEEHAWLYGVLKCPANQAPTFRFPDLISACVTAVLTPMEGQRALFAYLGSQLVLRDPGTPRRREAMWRHQCEQLQDLQRSALNQHPNPKFQLDQLMTAAVALCRDTDESGKLVLRYARQNMVQRAKQHPLEASGWRHGWTRCSPPRLNSLFRTIVNSMNFTARRKVGAEETSSSALKYL